MSDELELSLSVSESPPPKRVAPASVDIDLADDDDAPVDMVGAASAGTTELRMDFSSPELGSPADEEWEAPPPEAFQVPSGGDGEWEEVPAHLYAPASPVADGPSDGGARDWDGPSDGEARGWDGSSNGGARDWDGPSNGGARDWDAAHGWEQPPPQQPPPQQPAADDDDLSMFFVPLSKQVETGVATTAVLKQQLGEGRRGVMNPAVRAAAPPASETWQSASKKRRSSSSAATSTGTKAVRWISKGGKRFPIRVSSSTSSASSSRKRAPAKRQALVDQALQQDQPSGEEEEQDEEQEEDAAERDDAKEGDGVLSRPLKLDRKPRAPALWFQQVNRKRAKTSLGSGASADAVSTLLKKWWADADVDTRAPYVMLSLVDKERYSLVERATDKK